MQSTRGRYEGCLHAYRTIVRDEGVLGLWKGVYISVVRYYLHVARRHYLNGAS